MKKYKKFEPLTSYILQEMPNVSDKEFRLTAYLFAIFLFTEQTHCWIYFNELIEGRDKFIGNGKREKVLGGLGLNKRELIQAIQETNSRGLITIEAPEHSKYLLQISLNEQKDSK